MLSKRFIGAYNKIDKKLRQLYNVKSNATFPDTVRRAAASSALIRKYEDDLIDYARLRNAIVHSSSDDMTIAEPHVDVVEKLERIERLLGSPPRAVGTVAKRAVCFAADTKIRQAIERMARGNYSNVPVLRDGKVVGVLNNKLIVEAVAKRLDGDVDAYIAGATIGSILTPEANHYALLPDTASVDEILSAFEHNRKLQIVVLTYKGFPDGEIAGVVTTGDLLDVQRIMDDY